METYITVAFWMGIAGFTINMLTIATCEFPKQRTETLGMKLFQIILGGGFTVWAGMLIFS